MTAPLWPCSVANASPAVRASHSFTKASLEPEASRLLVGCHWQWRTSPPWPNIYLWAVGGGEGDKGGGWALDEAAGCWWGGVPLAVAHVIVSFSLCELLTAWICVNFSAHLSACSPPRSCTYPTPASTCNKSQVGFTAWSL